MDKYKYKMFKWYKKYRTVYKDIKYKGVLTNIIGFLLDIPLSWEDYIVFELVFVIVIECVLPDIIGFPLDNPPTWEEYLAFDPYRTGLTRPMWM